MTAKPENFSWLSPYILVKDVDEAIEFYAKAFGFKVGNKSPGKDGSTWHAELSYKDQTLMLGKADAYADSSKKTSASSPVTTGVDCPIFLYLYTENVDNFHDHAVSNGAISMSKPDDMFWGDRMCSLKDPDGYVWSFATTSNVSL